MGLQRYMGTGYAGSGYANSKTFTPTTHREGDTVYDADNNIAGIWKNGGLQKPTYNPSQGPLSVEAMTGAQQKPFDYSTTGLVSKAPPLAPQPAPTDTSVSAYGQGNKAIQDRWNALYSQAASQKNPYTAGALQAAIRQSEDNISAQYPNAQRRAREGMAARGMMGSGQESSLMNVLNAEQANAYGNARNTIESQFADKSNAWQQNQNSALMQALNGQFGALSGYVTQAKLPGEMTLQQQQIDSGYQNAERTKLELDMAKQEARLYGQTFEQRLAAKRAEYQAAAAQGALAEWEAKNAHWLGMVKGAGEILKAGAQGAGRLAMGGA